jgi:small-conductance mechanosensitive channel
VLYIINHYVIPLIKRKQHQINKYWQKLQIIAWLFFIGMFFIALIRANMFITLIFMVIILGLGWNFWSNIFSGIVIRFTNQFEPGEVISTDFAKGELKSINLSQSELINDKGETIVVPNKKLRGAVLTHYHKKSNVQMHSFTVEFSDKTIEAVYQVALNCPFISANQKIEVERTQGNEFNINAAVIDSYFVDKVNTYFKNQD